jgi:hypothetical protein
LGLCRHEDLQDAVPVEGCISVDSLCSVVTGRVDDKAVVGMDISALKSVFPMILPKTGAYLALSEA